jgi:hypothetical protein
MGKRKDEKIISNIFFFVFAKQPLTFNLNFLMNTVGKKIIKLKDK